MDTAQPGVSASAKRKFPEATGLRNRSMRAGRKHGAVLESSRNGKPSRKSTRKGDGAKQASGLTSRQQRRTSAPKVRASRARAKQPSGAVGR